MRFGNYRRGGLQSALIGALMLSLTGCASQVYSRNTLVLKGPAVDDYDIRYEELQGCLIRQQIPTVYIIRRAAYTLNLRMVPASAEDSPSIDVTLKSDVALSARFPGVRPEPQGYVSIEGSRYRVDASAMSVAAFDIEVYSGDRLLGSERLGVEPKSCKAVGWN
jgi:hypothetical protein